EGRRVRLLDRHRGGQRCRTGVAGGAIKRHVRRLCQPPDERVLSSAPADHQDPHQPETDSSAAGAGSGAGSGSGAGAGSGVGAGSGAGARSRTGVASAAAWASALACASASAFAAASTTSIVTGVVIPFSSLIPTWCV